MALDPFFINFLSQLDIITNLKYPKLKQLRYDKNNDKLKTEKQKVTPTSR